jgi:spermidine synthase
VSRRRRGPPSIVEPTDFGQAELIPETDRPGCWTLLINGLPQSHVDMPHPDRLHFDYLRWLGYVIDAAAARRRPLRVLHLGGGALALPRFTAATRPGSSQLVIERDAALMKLVRRVLPLPTRSGIRVRHAEACATVTAMAANRFDLVIADFPAMPARLSQEVSRLLRPGGLYAANLLQRAKTHVPADFHDVCLIADPNVLRGRRDGNVVLAACLDGPLRADQLASAIAREAQPVRLQPV